MESKTNETYTLFTEVYLFNETTLMGNETGVQREHFSGKTAMAILNIILVISNSLICATGLFGNCLVIYVVTMFSKMKTVTNTYILNLAIADVLFLISIPFLITTSLYGSWMFGFFMCKLYFLLVSINSFTGVFTLTVMSADRYLAVCHPLKSMAMRTPKVALLIIICIWITSILIMLPVLMYTTTVPSQRDSRLETCAMAWPEDQPLSPDKAFIWYNFLFSYAIPCSLISFFYIGVVMRLRASGPVKKSLEKKKSQKRVTRMVLSIIMVYIICWLPYWVFQLDLAVRVQKPPTLWRIVMFQAFNLMTYANSMLNPLLYNFLSDNFRKSFAKAFKCVDRFEANRSLRGENSIYPKGKEGYSQTTTVDKHELTNYTNCVMNKQIEDEGINIETQTENILPPTSELNEEADN